MILINLLPHREEKRQRKKVAFFAGLALSALAGLAIVGLWYLVVQQLTSVQQERNQYLSVEIKKLEVQIKDIAMLRAEIESLKARQKTQSSPAIRSTGDWRDMDNWRGGLRHEPAVWTGSARPRGAFPRRMHKFRDAVEQ